MSDDILYDLRHKQRLQEPRDMHKEPLWGRAADEIERLQGLVAKGLAVVHDLLALAHQYASECGECAGTRVCPDDAPCTECGFIWDVINKAEGKS